MRKKLLEGFSFDVDLFDLNKTIAFLRKYNVSYSTSDQTAELRENYFFYQERHYPHSAMRPYLELDVSFSKGLL